MNKLINDLFQTVPIKGNFVHLYHVGKEDAEFILKLRTEDRKDNFLMKTDNNLESQQDYINKYLEKFKQQEEIYFKIFDVKKGQFSGVVRLTDIQSSKYFGWESAVLDKSSSPNLFIDLMLIIYKVGFDILARETCGPWKVKKEFKKMMKIHKIIGMTEVLKEDNNFYELIVKKENYTQKIDYYNKRGLGCIK